MPLWPPMGGKLFAFGGVVRYTDSRRLLQAGSGPGAGYQRAFFLIPGGERGVLPCAERQGPRGRHGSFAFRAIYVTPPTPRAGGRSTREATTAWAKWSDVDRHIRFSPRGSLQPRGVERERRERLNWICPITLAVSMVILFSPGTSLAADVYEWRDGEGSAHFTDDLSQVPSFYRENARKLSLPEHNAPRPVGEGDEVGTQEEREEDLAPPPAVDAYTECETELQGEKDRLQKQLAEDQARLEDVNRGLHLEARTRFRGELERERSALRQRIADAERTQTEVFPQREWQCRRKRVGLPAPSSP